ncbi:pyridoxamine 5'-phosphate oxidase family protein [Micromonospora globispora]|uniref:Pyridoxamine 5'-phosphate oxidase family protein n=1 Tax=Micromonospora globispora TaxID=1450148 RepID=A0A317KHZ2_9ACTN|nr:pyridoxamine 5'-phosphate oxidase family protein [Micromonospora globispora]PWU52799.1 pyridoxamine 5'-phosphate oxidase family protein [Micromonospora globispora]PWU54553.1 pyridoxamine 5'-phosphate oxidase family protein [Micromonospora globispora]RQW91322.1 pyridoxamine 5'-phosphate oxidase family protein [Micromonospora globispora]
MVAPLTGGSASDGAGARSDESRPRAVGGTDRTRVRRLPDLAVHDRAALHAVLDAGRVAHLAIADGAQPYALPVAYARDNDRVLVHGSTGSRLFRHLAAGAPACLTVTLLDGLVLARSAFESSMNYRCAMVLGELTALHGDEKLAALERLSEQLLPGRWAVIRPPSAKELAATLVLALPLDECSVKISAGPPDDPEDDLDRPVWAGVVPIVESYGPPQPDPRLRVDQPPPEL